MIYLINNKIIMEQAIRIENPQEAELKLKKIRYFTALTLKYLPSMRLLIRGAKLGEKSGWRNVMEHSITEVAVADALADSIGLSNEEKEKLCIAAACHDWDKHLEKKPNDFNDDERKKAQDFLSEANPDNQLMAATKMEWLTRAVVDKKASLLEKLQFYIDDICKGSEIVLLDDRIDEAESREGNLGASKEYEIRLGGTYREKERELGHQIEQEVFDILRARGYRIDFPDNLPYFLKAMIESKIETNMERFDVIISETVSDERRGVKKTF